MIPARDINDCLSVLLFVAAHFATRCVYSVDRQYFYRNQCRAFFRCRTFDVKEPRMQDF